MSGIIKTIVVAIARNGVIGREGGLPWRLSTDLKRFKALTLGKPVVMGRKTFESIGRPLPGRPNVVVTRNKDFAAEGVSVASSLAEAIDMASALAVADGSDEICIIGGGDIYRQALDEVDQLQVTHVEADVEGDAFFPAIDPATWEMVEETHVPAGEKDSYATRFSTYRRRDGQKSTIFQ